MITKIHITTSVREKYSHQVEDVILMCSKKAEKIYQLEYIDVVVLHGESEIGIHGNSFYKDTILIVIDVNLESRDFESRLSTVYFHEFSHLARIASVGYGNSLQEALVTEGLAVATEYEMTDLRPAYYKFKDDRELSFAIKKFTEEKNNTDYDHSIWFFGGGKWPKYLGYKFGEYIISKYIDKTGVKASDLFATPAQDIVSAVQL